MEMFYIGRYLHITQGRGFCADRASETEAYLKKRRRIRRKNAEITLETWQSSSIY